ncbi:hypothetical protein BASA81_007121 [Batrachochytrium salamandrivorans]|nr:hypothetical protein BASA81_007121 [Batrachochytrium salamandrivorans]
MMSMQEFYNTQSRTMPYHSSSPTPPPSSSTSSVSLLLPPRQPVLMMGAPPQWDLGASNPPVQIHNDWGIPASHMALTQPVSSAMGNGLAQPAAQRSTTTSRKRSKLDHEEPEAITSKYRGVCWYKRTRRWVAQTKINGKRVHLGYFDDEESAAQAYRDKVSTLERGKGAAASAAAATTVAATTAATTVAATTAAATSYKTE